MDLINCCLNILKDFFVTGCYAEGHRVMLFFVFCFVSGYCLTYAMRIIALFSSWLLFFSLFVVATFYVHGGANNFSILCFLAAIFIASSIFLVAGSSLATVQMEGKILNSMKNISMSTCGEIKYFVIPISLTDRQVKFMVGKMFYAVKQSNGDVTKIPVKKYLCKIIKGGDCFIRIPLSINEDNGSIIIESSLPCPWCDYYELRFDSQNVPMIVLG